MYFGTDFYEISLFELFRKIMSVTILTDKINYSTLSLTRPDISLPQHNNQTKYMYMISSYVVSAVHCL